MEWFYHKINGANSLFLTLTDIYDELRQITKKIQLTSRHTVDKMLTTLLAIVAPQYQMAATGLQQKLILNQPQAFCSFNQAQR